jgi:hypothetical protein
LHSKLQAGIFGFACGAEDVQPPVGTPEFGHLAKLNANARIDAAMEAARQCGDHVQYRLWSYWREASVFVQVTETELYPAVRSSAQHAQLHTSVGGAGTVPEPLLVQHLN